MVDIYVNSVGPLLVIFFLSYLISKLFIELYDSGSNTMLKCFMLDDEVGNDDEEYVPWPIKQFFDNEIVQGYLEQYAYEQP